MTGRKISVSLLISLDSPISVYLSCDVPFTFQDLFTSRINLYISVKNSHRLASFFLYICLIFLYLTTSNDTLQRYVFRITLFPHDELPAYCVPLSPFSWGTDISIKERIPIFNFRNIPFPPQVTLYNNLLSNRLTFLFLPFSSLYYKNLPFAWIYLP